MRYRIEADQLIVGRGEPVADGVVVLDGPLIVYAGPAGVAPQSPDAAVVHARTVMPGLWDCHGHLVGARSVDMARLVLEPVALRAARCVADLRAALDAGVTSVREVGGLGVDLARAVAEDSIQGPSVYAAGAVISTTGGHGDLHGFSPAAVADFARAGGELRLADGPVDCAKAVREQLRRNVRVIKVHASGGVLSEVDHPVHQQFTQDELCAMVEVAGMAERVVAAHCHGKAGLMAALRAGVRTIEHGTYLDQEAAVAMRECGAVLVGTRTIFRELLDAEGVPAYAVEKLKVVAERHAEALAIAREAGVTMAAGSDIALSGSRLPASWGRNGRELALLVECGFTALEAIEAATANGPATLGAQAPRSGMLVDGFDADVIVVDGDPVADITVLSRPQLVTRVWKAGRKVKG